MFENTTDRERVKKRKNERKHRRSKQVVDFRIVKKIHYIYEKIWITHTKRKNYATELGLKIISSDH
jgi:hypothetical protein